MCRSALITCRIDTFPLVQGLPSRLKLLIPDVVVVLVTQCGVEY